MQKWGGLAKLPFAPRVFTDFYSVASTTFDPGRENQDGHDEARGAKRTPVKGVVGWIDEETIAVVSAGTDARYERFAFTGEDVGDGTEGLKCFRIGYSRYMRPN